MKRHSTPGSIEPVTWMTPIAIVDLGRSEAEVQRVMAICNACRYCEGFCAVFPAMERRLDFLHGDIHFLANLCHNCGACFHSCQYAPPHAFAVNVPKALAEVRAATYEAYAWPAALGALYRHQGAWLGIALAIGLAFFMLIAMQQNAGVFVHPGAQRSFYAVIPHAAMAAPFVMASLWILLAFGIGLARFWRGLPAKPQRVSLSAAAAEAASSALTLRNLDGGGAGCNDQSDAPSPWRRRFHHATFYGFVLCFASTCIATWYHYVLKLQAPYAMTSLPVLLGSLGGAGLLVGTAGLLWLHARRHPVVIDRTQRAMDVGFMALLFAVSLTGLLLLVFRDSVLMPLLLAVHLGVVAAFFITVPYGKFAHAVYRVAALLKDAIEKRQSNTTVLKSPGASNESSQPARHAAPGEIPFRAPRATRALRGQSRARDR